MRIVLATLAAFALVGCTPGSDEPLDETPATPDNAERPPPVVQRAMNSDLTAQGWGPLRIGMTIEQVTAALGPDANPEAVGGPEPEVCDEFRPEKAPEGLLVMMQQRRLSRISLVELSSLKTDKGLGIGDTADAVKAAYGAAALVSPHKYQGPPAEYITVWEGGPRAEPFVQDQAARGIVYEIDGTGKVGAIHAGGPSIQYVEGCL